MTEEKIKFEDALERLESIVKSLQEEGVSLDDALKKFEEGVRLIRICSKMLNEAEGKVEKLVEKNGKVQREPLEI